MHPPLQTLISAGPPEPVSDLSDWWSRHQRVTADQPHTVWRAALAGRAMDRVGYAFASGYHEALRRLDPGLQAAPTALAATEGGSAHPRDIATRLEPDGDGWRLSGAKGFVTLGRHARQVIVIAREGVDATGRPRLVAVRVPTDREGVSLVDAPAIPFVPEIPHTRVAFDAVRVAADERLPGDGYADVMKPFRTVEDVHVHAALIGWLIGIARKSGWPEEVVEGWLPPLLALHPIADERPDSPATHVALAGVIARTARLLDETAGLWSVADPEDRARWERDRALLNVAGKARARRRRVAWESLDHVDEP